MRFVLIDQITGWEPGSWGTASKCVALSEDFFEDHFPQRPIMPGALILEGLAQLSGLLLEEAVELKLGLRVKALLSMVEKLKLRAPVEPGSQLEYRAEISSLNERGGRTEVRATCNGAVRAEGQLLFAFADFANPRLERRQRDMVALLRRGLA